ncbi:hypothetical protein Arnit_0623 [Arcobacter nitrofigilis DSM 7299]|uniref:Uncharacterized protein n=1 Tax=Arcobacter nitrofigilis (strain ATCC 33309 / DSM 7299 / CCUG 15893 / LMG 7604 / NCTC 12251 / CI) TaxID=572480 RepID=D5V255_ARCNC|nr:hypothetical protein Arnit_0623 [Arcobacter nitrofigilis DSM 7299]
MSDIIVYAVTIVVLVALETFLYSKYSKWKESKKK